MNALWAYFWPCFAAGLLVGAIIGRITFRRRSGREVRLALGVAVSFVLAALWHGPLGGADRFQTKIERDIQQMLVDYEMTKVSAHLHQHPLSRRVMLSGPADDFQRQGLIEYLDHIPGVESATWSKRGGMPLIAEGMIVSLLGFLFGLLLAYLVELRRRYNAQWNW
jgi:cell division protein FtsX